jgi:hypothetical protein
MENQNLTERAMAERILAHLESNEREHAHGLCVTRTVLVGLCCAGGKLVPLDLMNGVQYAAGTGYRQAVADLADWARANVRFHSAGDATVRIILTAATAIAAGRSTYALRYYRQCTTGLEPMAEKWLMSH